MKDDRPRDSRPLVQLSSGSASDHESESPFYELREGIVWFSEEIKREHRRLKTSLWRYVRRSRFFVALTSPLIYGCIIPFLLLDLFVTIYQAFSFPSMASRRPGARITSFLIGTNCVTSMLSSASIVSTARTPMD